MPFIKIWVHLVFGTKSRYPFLNQDVLAKVITHILQNGKEKGIFLDSVNGYTDHLHCLVSLSASLSIAKTANLIKGESSFWINKNKLTPHKFEWADEYYAASVSESQINRVREYIRNQQEHHKKLSHSEECEKFIQEYGCK
ncbi:MAG: IS200/IS605 family transposase [Bacteroidetes bacterium]|nr:IS200/IS605 family transposase [Bacteroidota bacterium]